MCRLFSIITVNPIVSSFAGQALNAQYGPRLHELPVFQFNETMLSSSWSVCGIQTSDCNEFEVGRVSKTQVRDCHEFCVHGIIGARYTGLRLSNYFDDLIGLLGQ